MNPKISGRPSGIPKHENSLPNSIKGSKLTSIENPNCDSGRTTATKNMFGGRKFTREEGAERASKELMKTMNLTGLVSSKGYRLE